MATDGPPERKLDPRLSDLIAQYFYTWRTFTDSGVISEPKVDGELNATFRLRTALISFFIHQNVTDITMTSEDRPIGRNERIYDIEFRANIVIAAATPELFEFLIRRTGSTTPAAVLGVTDYNSRLVVVQAHKRYSDCGNYAVDFERHVHPFLYAVQELGKEVIQRFGGVPFTTALDGADLRSSYIPPGVDQPAAPTTGAQVGNASDAVPAASSNDEQSIFDGNRRYQALLQVAGMAYVLISPTAARITLEYLTKTLRLQFGEGDADTPEVREGNALDGSFDIFVIALESLDRDKTALLFWSGDHISALAATLAIKSFPRYARKELGAELLAVTKGEMVDVRDLMRSPPKFRTTGEFVTEGTIDSVLRTMAPV